MAKPIIEIIEKETDRESGKSRETGLMPYTCVRTAIVLVRVVIAIHVPVAMLLEGNAQRVETSPLVV